MSDSDGLVGIVALKQVVLEKVKLSIHAHFPCFGNGNYDVRFLERDMDELVMRLSFYLAGKKEETNVTNVVHVPANWWQGLRERWLPKFWLCRWPVKTRRIDTVTTVANWRVCPHVPVPGGMSEHFNWIGSVREDVPTGV
jgi:hypothetical protein